LRFVRFGGIPFLDICSERTGGSAVIMAVRVGLGGDLVWTGLLGEGC